MAYLSEQNDDTQLSDEDEGLDPRVQVISFTFFTDPPPPYLAGRGLKLRRI